MKISCHKRSDAWMHSCEEELKRQLLTVGMSLSLSLSSHQNSAASGHLQLGHAQAVQSYPVAGWLYKLLSFGISGSRIVALHVDLKYVDKISV